MAPSVGQIWKLLLILVVAPGGQNWNQSLAWILLFTEFACFVTGEITQVIEAMPGSVVPLAMFLKVIGLRSFWSKFDDFFVLNDLLYVLNV